MSDEQLIKTPCVFGENGNFMLERELGSGGMGSVYMGQDKMLERPVAVKVMLKKYGSDEKSCGDFKKEAQAAARLIHPNIAQIYSYGFVDGMPYIAMELVAGGSLDGLMKVHGKTIDVARVMKIGEQIAQALRCAADQGLVHGDVKPENVLLDANGNAKLVDFGLAAMQHDTDQIMGTPYYIAPEKVDKKPVDYRADMFSLGATIYHALTGVAPFEGEDHIAVVRKRFEGAPLKPSVVRPGLSPKIDFLLLKMMAVDPQDRYPSFEALLEDFKTVMTSGLSATQQLSTEAAPANGGQGARPAAGGSGKKLTLKTKRFKVASSSKSESTDEAGDQDDASSGSGKKTIGRFKPRLSNVEEGESAPAEDDENGSLGGKVVMVILSVLLVIGLVCGGLWWMTASFNSGQSKAAEEKVRSQCASLNTAYETLLTSIDQFDASIDTEITNAVKNCEVATKKIADEILSKKVLPETLVDTLKIPKTPDLLKAEATLRPPAEEKAGADGAAAEGVAKPADGAAAADAPAPAAVKRSEERFPDPVGDEADPNSPEGEEYLKKKNAWLEQKKAEAEAKAKEAEAAASAEEEGSADGTAEEAKPAEEEKLACVEKINKAWEDLYAAQAAAIYLHRDLKALRENITTAMGAVGSIGSQDEVVAQDNVRQNLADRLRTLKESKEADKIFKIARSVKSDGERAFKDCQQKQKKLIQDRDEEARIAKEKEDSERRKKEEADRLEALRQKELREVESVSARFASRIQQLDWESTLSEYERVRKGMKTKEGMDAIRLEIDRVELMALMQDVIKRKSVGYTFRKRPTKRKQIAGYTIKGFEKDELVLVDKDNKEMKLRWTILYHDYLYHTYDLYQECIVGGTGKGKFISKSEKAKATLGYALTLRIICKHDLDEKMEKYVKTAAEKAVGMNCTPQFKELAEKLMPDVDFSKIAAQAQDEML